MSQALYQIQIPGLIPIKAISKWCFSYENQVFRSHPRSLGGTKPISMWIRDKVRTHCKKQNRDNVQVCLIGSNRCCLKIRNAVLLPIVASIALNDIGTCNSHSLRQNQTAQSFFVTKFNCDYQIDDELHRFLNTFSKFKQKHIQHVWT